MKVSPVSLLSLAALAPSLSAQLIITEVMSDSNHSDSTANGDWFEVTNTGDTAVNVGGYSFDDESDEQGASGPFPSFSLAAGASLIVLNEASSTSFRSLWNLPASFRIITNTEIEDFQGLGSGGDTVFLFSSQQGTNPVDTFVFGAATEGFSFARFRSGQSVPGSLSIAGLLGAFESNDPSEDVGSPGFAATPPEPLPPFFDAPFHTAGIAGSSLASSEFRVVSFDPNPGDTITITSSGTPPWLTVNDLGNGTASFTGTPPLSAVGPHEFQVTATDNTGLATSQTYLINVLSPSSPIILNEYNAVAADEFLGGGAEDEVDAAVDPRLDRVAGNGGGWVEFVVTGPTGSPVSTVDLRNWSLRIENDDAVRLLKLADHPSLAAINTGTLLTFTENAFTAASAFDIDNQLNTSGFSWTNISVHDPILIDQTNSIQPADRVINSSNTRFTWLNGADEIVYGPSGESIATRDSNANGIGDDPISIGGSETLRLELNPAATVTPININYDDANSSTFGLPNEFGTVTQSFANFSAANASPSFGPVAVRKAARGSYSVDVAVTAGSTITALTLPDFLQISTATGVVTISNTRPLTPADIGSFEITLQADNGNPTRNLSFLVYELEVLHPAPSVILNEYNAVSNDRFLNGGTLSTDSDGAPASSDTHFGRVLGNGGNWFELAVVGNGSAGFSDITDWSIEVGTLLESGAFAASSTILLSDPDTWSAVANGTLLTFIDRNSSAGGLDTQINRVDLLNTEGYAWTNIHLSTPGTVTGTGLANLSVNSSDTTFVIRDSEGTVIFGPAGEGIAPISGVGNEEIFELENDPSPQVASIDDSSATELGYDDGSSGSTFGAPNLFAPIGSATDRAQDFSPYILSLFQSFLADSGLPNADPAADSDGDGFSNLEEYLLGGDPAVNSIFPRTTIDQATGTVSLDVRTNDPSFVLIAQRSPDLVNFFTDQLVVTDEASDLGTDFVLRNIVFEGSAPRMFFRVTTAE
ncbi:lamin tail domain-containing protein [bacterium]|nr:lamin tail domain-containing protein [bacterium]